jgi:outer membrane protein assembly factor BamB
MYSSPLVSGGKVIVSLGAPAGQVRAYEPLRGELLWNLELPQVSYSSAAASGNYGVVGCNDGSYTCFRLSDGAVVWRFRTGGGISLSSPCIRQETVYLAPGNFDYQMYALRISTGELLWQTTPTVPSQGKPTDGSASSEPSPASSVLDSFIQEAMAVPPDAAEAMIALYEQETGEDLTQLREALFWNGGTSHQKAGTVSSKPFFTMNEIRTSSPAADESRVYILQRELGSPEPRFTLYALNAADGSTLWAYQIQQTAPPADYEPSPVVTSDGIYASLADTLVLLNPANGTPLVSSTLGGRLAGPTVSNGKVLVGSDANLLYAFQSANRAPAPPSAGFGPSGDADQMLNQPTLQFGPGSDPEDPVSGLRYLVQLDDDGELEEDFDLQGTTLPGTPQWTPPYPLSDGTQIAWRVRTLDSNEALSGWSNTQRFWVNRGSALPNAPQDFEALGDDQTVALNWTQPDTPFAGFRLAIRSGSEFGLTVPIDGNTTSYTATGLANYTEYTFVLNGYDAAGNESPGIFAVATPRPLITLNDVVPYATITGAIAAASPGDFVRVGRGTFDQTYALKEGVRLIGYGPGHSILHLPSMIPGGSTAVISIIPSGSPGTTEISGFTIQGGNIGVEVGALSPLIRNNLIIGNETGIQVSAGSSAQIRNNTIADNTADGLQSASSDLTVRNNIFSENGGYGIHATGSGTLRSSFCNFFNNTLGAVSAGVDSGLGNFQGNPLFSSKGPADYLLLAASPCVDAGDPTDPYDLEPVPHGYRINQGAHGNTPFATSTPAKPGGEGGTLGGLSGAGARGGGSCFIATLLEELFGSREP